MKVHDYERLFMSGRVETGIIGLCGRVIRGTKPDDFRTLTDDPKRKLVLLVGPDGLQLLLGKTGLEALQVIGYEPEYIRRKVIEERNEFKLVVFEEGAEAVPATWDNVIAVVSRVYPEAAAMLYRNREALRNQKFEDIESLAGYDFSEVDKSGVMDPRFMTYERLQASCGNLVAVRSFLYFTVHLREQFSGDGYTYDDRGNRGLMEYIVENKPIHDLGEHALIDIEVSIPTTKGSTMKQTTITATPGGLPLPPFYDSANAGKWGYNPSIRQLVTLAPTWAGDHGIKPAATDKKTVTLLLIDEQQDFTLPQGTLYVGGRSGTGSIDDSNRVAQFIYREMSRITRVRVTMDTHFAFQIFSPAFWLDANGKAPNPFSFIVADEAHVKPYMAGNVLIISKGEVRPNPAMAQWLFGGNYTALVQQVMYYCGELNRTGKYDLIMWPEHCLIGGEGHALVGVIQEARMFHAYTRVVQAEAEVKGGHPLLECYSVLGGEVLTFYDRSPMAQKNVNFINVLLASDYTILGGQAGSHCVAASTDDLLHEIMKHDPRMVERVYVMKDCMSAVTVPDGRGGFIQDFTPQMEAAFARWEKAGMKLVNSTDPMETWGMNL